VKPFEKLFPNTKSSVDARTGTLVHPCTACVFTIRLFQRLMCVITSLSKIVLLLTLEKALLGRRQRCYYKHDVNRLSFTNPQHYCATSRNCNRSSTALACDKVLSRAINRGKECRLQKIGARICRLCSNRITSKVTPVIRIHIDSIYLKP
jgi:hypothetical protein